MATSPYGTVWFIAFNMSIATQLTEGWTGKSTSVSNLTDVQRMFSVCLCKHCVNPNTKHHSIYFISIIVSQLIPLIFTTFCWDLILLPALMHLQIELKFIFTTGASWWLFVIWYCFVCLLLSMANYELCWKLFSQVNL